MADSRQPKAESQLAIPRTIYWEGDLAGHVVLIDQTLLPTELKLLACHDLETLREAIVSLRVRGAPAIGIAAAFGLVLGVRDVRDTGDVGRDVGDAERVERGDAVTAAEFKNKLHSAAERLASSRPTAVNLCWALDRMKACADRLIDRPISQIKQALLAEAKAIRDEDALSCRAIGKHGQDLIPQGAGVLTHCNAGSLATAEYGTALALLYAAHEKGRKFRVFASETRPLLQGSRLTAWELSRAGIDTTVLCDNMAAHLMKEGHVDLVITGADRIAANGDVANKIGTYGLAILAKQHGIPFYVAAPTSTFDLSLSSGAEIPIEHRSSDELSRGFGRVTAPDGVNFYSPAFDVTPADLVTEIITELGRICPVSREIIKRFFSA